MQPVCNVLCKLLVFLNFMQSAGELQVCLDTCKIQFQSICTPLCSPSIFWGDAVFVCFDNFFFEAELLVCFDKVSLRL